MPGIEKWLYEHQILVAALAAFSGFVAGPVVTFFRATVGYLNDRSWDHVASKNTTLIAECIRDLQEAEKPATGVWAQALELYSAVLKERLECATQQLQRLQKRQAAHSERQAVQARRRLEEPRGMHKWLLLFRPYGPGAVVLHSLFYGILCMNLAIFVQAIRIHKPEHFAFSATVIFVASGLALLPRSIALRRKRLMILKGDQPESSRDHTCQHTLTLIFQAPDKASRIEQILCCLCLVAVLLGIGVGVSLLKNPNSNVHFYEVIAFLTLFILPSWMLGYDVLLRRGLAKLTRPNIPENKTVSKPPDAVLTTVGAGSAGHLFR